MSGEWEIRLAIHCFLLANMKRMVFVIFFSILLLIGGFVWLMFDLQKRGVEVSAGELPTAVLDLGDRQVLVEVADNERSRTRGLSYRESMDAERGMYFIFNSSTVQYFWMFQMKFPIDIVFINDDTVVSVSSNVPNPKRMSPPAIVNSRVPANRVLELNAGKAEEWGIKEGSKVKLLGD